MVLAVLVMLLSGAKGPGNSLSGEVVGFHGLGRLTIRGVADKPRHAGDPSKLYSVSLQVPQSVEWVPSDFRHFGDWLASFRGRPVEATVVDGASGPRVYRLMVYRYNARLPEPGTGTVDLMQLVFTTFVGNGTVPYSRLYGN